MICECGKECGIRIWCEECEEKHIKEIDDIRLCLKKAIRNFKVVSGRIVILGDDNNLGANTKYSDIGE